MKKIFLTVLAGTLTLFFVSSYEIYRSPDSGDYENDSTGVHKLYLEQYDKIRDEGQYWLPKLKKAKDYWIVINATSNDNNFEDNSLRNHILAESIIGLTALAVNEGESSTMVWTESPNSDYEKVLDKIGLKKNGKQTTWELLKYHDNVKSHIKGYVLCNVQNQESLTVATIASHVYRSVIIDEYYEQRIKDLGYELKYDARNKTLVDGWNEFKDKCKNDALVLMPTLTGNLKSFAIANRLMAFNYNKIMNAPSLGNNKELFEEVLDWLEPLSPVLGWESGIGEDVFVDPVSRHGNMMVPSDWLWNVDMMSANYEKNQPGVVSVTNPQRINFSDSFNYASFLLTDGDNVQWMMNGFTGSTYYNSYVNSDLKMSFGIPVSNLSMISPFQLEKIFNEQKPTNTLIEYGGGGYYYPDNFGVDENRPELLTGIAKKVASHMRQHRVKVLGLICKDVKSVESQEAFKAYVENNDQLIGIIAIQYAPYSGGNGDVMWFTNTQGFDIPVITARYSIWNFGDHNKYNDGTPTYIAQKINELAEQSISPAFSLVAVHAWSKFKDIGNSMDPLAENIGGNEAGPVPASWCKRKINSKTKVVNVEELIWQLRMHKKPKQTTDFLSIYH